MNIGLRVNLKVWDQNGVVIHSSSEPGRSLVTAFLSFLLGGMKDGSAGSPKNIAGTPVQVSGTPNYSAPGAANDEDLGIIVGTDNTTVDITDFQLIAAILDGTSSGELLYALQVYDAAVTTSDPDVFFSTSRNFNNNSGGAIIIKETGIYASNGNGNKYCIVRDVPTELSVPNGGGAHVEYTFTISE